MTEKCDNSRDKRYDYIAGILILGMMYSHIGLNLAGGLPSIMWIPFTRTIEMVIVPWFFYKSGMFFKRKKIKEVFYGGGKFLKPYILFSIFGVILNLLFIITKHGNANILKIIQTDLYSLLMNGYVPENLPTWFLLSLWITNLLFCIFRHLKINVLIIIAITIFFNLLLLTIKSRLPLIIINVNTGLFFFSLGCLLKDTQYKKFVYLSSWALFILSASIFYERMAYFRDVTTSPFPIILSLSGIIIMNNLFTRCSPLKLINLCLFTILLLCVIIQVYNFFEKKSPFNVHDVLSIFITIAFVISIYIGENIKSNIFCLAEIGKCSMIYLVCHWPLFYIINLICYLLGNQSNHMLLNVGFGLNMICLPIIVWTLTNTRLKLLIK